MIDWNTSLEDLKTIDLIVNRLQDDTLSRLDRMTLTMDIAAAHQYQPIDLERLLAANDSNFYHDVNGIVVNLDRTTGLLENCFVPRYSL